MPRQAAPHLGLPLAGVVVGHATHREGSRLGSLGNRAKSRGSPGLGRLARRFCAILLVLALGGLATAALVTLVPFLRP